jgi:predicted O-methyltransferase YrrM
VQSLEAVLNDPPQVHSNAPGGVWATDRDCYEFLWSTLSPTMRTLETGCGVSTAVFAARGTTHTAVFHFPDEGERFRDWAAARDIDISQVDLRCGPSVHVLPQLPDEPLDAVLIDGNHAFPFPIIEWFHAGRRLRQGGVLVVDDAQIPGVQRLVEFLDHDPRWSSLRDGRKWRAYRRTTDTVLDDEWWGDQRFLPPVRAGDVRFVARVRRRLRLH